MRGRAHTRRRWSGPLRGQDRSTGRVGRDQDDVRVEGREGGRAASSCDEIPTLAAEFGDHGYLEPIYQRLFLRELASHGLSDKYTPIQSAANYSLLFILLQSVVRAQPAEILELGCGETTLLLDALRRSGIWRGNLTSIEHDRFWHKEISARVETDIVLAPLTKQTIRGIEAPAYDLSTLKKPLGTFDLVLIDGPNGTPRWSRLACLQFIPDHLAREFLIILDDYERPGERETAVLIRDSLESKGLQISEECILSNKHQLMLATAAYRPCSLPDLSQGGASRETRGWPASRAGAACSAGQLKDCTRSRSRTSAERRPPCASP